MTTENKQKFIELKNCIKCYEAHLDGGFNPTFFPFISDLRACAYCNDNGLCRELEHLTQKWMNNE